MKGGDATEILELLLEQAFEDGEITESFCKNLEEAGLGEYAKAFRVLSAIEGNRIRRELERERTTAAPKFEIRNLGTLVVNQNGTMPATTFSEAAAQGAGVASLLAKLTREVESDSILDDALRKQSIQSLRFVEQQAQAPPEQRQLGLLKPVLEWIPKVLSSAAALSTLWAKYGPHISHFFGL